MTMPVYAAKAREELVKRMMRDHHPESTTYISTGIADTLSIPKPIKGKQ